MGPVQSIEITKTKTGNVELRTAKTGTEFACPIPDDVATAVINQPGKHPFSTGNSNAED